MNAIETRDLTKKYKDLTAVDHLNLTVEAGTTFALLGINGAGKSTTVNMLCCLLSPTEGDARLTGYSICSAPDKVKEIIGVSPQETAVAPGLSVKENLALLCGLYGYSKEKQAQKIMELTEEFRLSSILSKKAGKLSGGWQRRLSIAMALVGEPQILFLDEPTLGLDVIARSELWNTIRALHGRVTVVLTTHDMQEAESLSDCIGIMRDGRLLAMGTAAELKRLTETDALENAFVRIVTKGKEAVQ